MIASSTKYGKRYDCPIASCTVMCWGGETSTPADYETRQLRKECHGLFDALPMRKASRYKWLAEKMNLEPGQAHIGMFDKEQCMRLIEIIGD